MGKILDRLNAIEATQDQAIARVQEDVAAQQAEIETLKNRDLSAEEQVVFDRIVVKNEALDPVKPTTLPPAEGEGTGTGTGTETEG